MAAGEANPPTWGTWPSPRCHPDLPGLKEVHSAWPLSVSRPLSLSPIITHMSDRQAFPFDGAGDFKWSCSDDPPPRMCVCVSDDVCMWAPPGVLISCKSARWWFWASFQTKTTTMMMITLVAKCAKNAWCKGISGAATVLRESQKGQRRQRHKATDLLNVCVCVCVCKEKGRRFVRV